jgi:hypothetical protein
MRKNTKILLGILLIAGAYLFMNQPGNIIGGSLIADCLDTDGGDQPYVAGEVKGRNGPNNAFPWYRVAKDECTENDTILRERICVQAKWAQDAKEYNSGWQWSTIKHTCDCVTPPILVSPEHPSGIEQPAYCAANTATTTTTTTQPHTTTTIDDDTIPDNSQQLLILGLLGAAVVVAYVGNRKK